MNKTYVFPAIFLLLLCCGCRKAGKQTEIMRHHERLLHALVANDTATLHHEQCYVADTLPCDSLKAFPHMREYLCTWVNSYRFGKETAEEAGAETTGNSVAGGSTGDSAAQVSTATERIAADVKHLAVRLLDARKEKQLEEMLRIVALRLLELGMNDAAAVSAAAAVGIDADPARPGDIAHRLLTRLLLVGKKAPELTHTVPSVSSGPTLLLFYETDCPECETLLRKLCGSYATLKGRGTRVVSIASDDDGEVFRARASSLPWATKWRATYGFYSADFEAYGIVATPTIVAVDRNGRVAGYYHTLEEYEQSNTDKHE